MECMKNNAKQLIDRNTAEFILVISIRHVSLDKTNDFSRSDLLVFFSFRVLCSHV